MKTNLKLIIYLKIANWFYVNIIWYSFLVEVVIFWGETIRGKAELSMFKYNMHVNKKGISIQEQKM